MTHIPSSERRTEPGLHPDSNLVHGIIGKPVGWSVFLRGIRNRRPSIEKSISYPRDTQQSAVEAFRKQKKRKHFLCFRW